MQLWHDGREIVAGLVLFTAVIAPALQIGFMLAIVLGAHRARPPRWVGTLLRHHPTTRTWSMIEVMMLGVLVALIKIADYATVIPGLALFVLGGARLRARRRCRRASTRARYGSGSSGRTDARARRRRGRMAEATS